MNDEDVAATKKKIVKTIIRKRKKKVKRKEWKNAKEGERIIIKKQQIEGHKSSVGKS